MDEEALVETLISEGAQLEAALQADNELPGGLTTVARDVELDEWNLLIPLPGERSRLHFYEVLQDYLRSLDLTLPLDRIVLVKDADPGFRELRSASTPAYARGAWRTTPVEVAGRYFSSPVRVRIEPRFFEQQVASALRTAFPSAEFLDLRDLRDIAERPHGRRERPSLLPVDLAFRYRNKLLLVEVKVSRRPLTHSPALTSFGALCYLQRLTREPVCMALVSATGFSDRVEQALGDFPDLALVAWQVHQGPRPLVDAMERLAD